MQWSKLCTPNSTGTALSSDHYHQSNLSKYFAFYHMGISNSNGKIGFPNRNERKIESIQMQRINNGKWMTINQVLVSTMSNQFIVKAVNRRSERIRNNQKATNDALKQQ